MARSYVMTKPRRGNNCRLDKVEAESLLRAGLSIRHVAAKMGVAENTIGNFRKQLIGLPSPKIGYQTQGVRFLTPEEEVYSQTVKQLRKAIRETRKAVNGTTDNL